MVAKLATTEWFDLPVGTPIPVRIYDTDRRHITYEGPAIISDVVGLPLFQPKRYGTRCSFRLDVLPHAELQASTLRNGQSDYRPGDEAIDINDGPCIVLLDRHTAPSAEDVRTQLQAAIATAFPGVTVIFD